MRASKIKINWTYTDEYHIKPKGRIEVPTPTERVEVIVIKGRDGTLTRNSGYNDIPLPVHFTMHETVVGFKQIFRKAKHHLLNAKTLIFDDDEDVFYKVKSVQIQPAENTIKTFGEFVVDFVLDPFQYEVINDPITITGQRTIINDGHEALPIITATVAGTGKIYINDQEVTIQNVNGTIVIDSEMQNAYRKTSVITESMNKHMIGKFLVLESGSNVVRFDGDVSKLEIITNFRWK